MTVQRYNNFLKYTNFICINKKKAVPLQPKRCLLGKTMNYYSLLYQGKYDELVHEAYSVLDTNKDAERAFLRMFMELDTVYLFKPETVAFIETEARKGNRHMQYVYARYLFGLRPTEQAIHEVFDLLSAAAQQGLADAKAVLADMYGYGDIDIVDYNKEETLMHEAFDEGSEMAAMYILRNYCYGQHFHAPRPDLASEMADDLIARDEQAGIEPNGIWYYYRGVANEHYESKTRLVANYLRAAELGVRRAYGEIMIAYGYGDSATLHQTPDYNLWMEKGIDHRACSAYFLAALGEMMKTSEIMRDEDALFSMLTQAAKMGHTGATELEGDMFLEGSYQWKQDYKRAAESYYRAIDNGSAGAAEKLWRMIAHDHLIDRPLHEVDRIALIGARLGSAMLLAETVVAFQEGRLQEYKKEITTYYEPIFDDPEFSTDGEFYLHDDDEDDDGRWDAWA